LVQMAGREVEGGERLREIPSKSAGDGETVTMVYMRDRTAASRQVAGEVFETRTAAGEEKRGRGKKPRSTAQRRRES